MNPPRASWLDRALRALVRLLPAEFRSDFGGAIDADLADRRWHGDRRGLLRRELPSLAVAVVRENADVARQDVTYALRALRRTPGFTALAVVMLALGTGANAALFSVIDAVMLRLPFTGADRIVIVGKDDGRGFSAALTQADFDALVAAPGPLSEVAGLTGGTHVLSGGDGARTLRLECVSASMFAVLGTPPRLGRTLGPADDHPGAAPAIVLGALLYRELGGSPAIVGTTITINRTPVTIVGVMPPGFGGPFESSRVSGWVPLHRPIAGGGAAGCGPTGSETLINAFGRMKDGLTIEAARGQLPGIALLSLGAQSFSTTRTPFLVLTGAVVCVLLIACVNVGGLQMERTLARRPEMALRLALGASRSRLVRQTLTENVLLAVTGALAGLAATRLSLGAIVSLMPANLPRLDQVAVNARVFIVTIGVAAIAGVLAGALPIVHLRNVSLQNGLTGGRSTGRRGQWTRRGLVAGEIALSVVVLIGAALMLQTFLTLRPTSPGFDAAGKLSTEVRLPDTTPEAGARFFDVLLDRLSQAPATRRVAGSTYIPLLGVTAGGLTYDAVTSRVNTIRVTPGYFDLMKIPVLAGRAFEPGDTASAPPVMMVNERLARLLDDSGAVVGRSLHVRARSEPDTPAVERRIVGVIADGRFYGSRLDALAEAYVPFAQMPQPWLRIIVAADAGRAATAAAEVRRAIRELRPDVAAEEFLSLEAIAARSVQRPRLGAWLLGVFAALAVGLAAIGLLTTMGWWVRQRTRELGVRVALGATRGDVARLVLRQGLATSAAGIALGCAAAAGLTRFMEAWIYGVTPLDPLTFGACATGMLLIAACAVCIPARRATSVDPMRALRAE